jgi:thiamine transporter
MLAEGKNMSKTFSTRALSEIVVIIALSTVLSYIKIYHLPQGGSITAGSMVPLLWLSLRRGAKIGLFASIVYGIVQLLVEPFVYHPVQVLLDYPLAFGALGLAGFFTSYALIGVAVGIFGRFVSHLLSGVIFFAEYAPEGMSPIVYSAIYNGSYLIGELIVSAVLTYIIIKRGLLTIYLE